MSAEYIMAGGNEQVILCERGIRTFETATRNTLDLSAIPVLRQMTHLPVIVDPSHATGVSRLVKPMALASVVSGADGLMIEVHNDPKHALCDGAQSLTPEAFADAARPYIRQAVQREDISVDDIAALLQARCEKLTDIPEKVDFFQALPEYDAELFTNKKSKTNAEVSKAMLEAAIPMLRQLPDWTQDAIHDGLVELAAKLEVKNATLMWPVRIAAAGKTVTPGGAVEICRILGREETLKRLELGLEKLK